jgi:cytochrome b561
MTFETVKKYNTTAVILHWVVAILILGLLLVGWLMTDLEKGSDLRRQVYTLHKSFGLIVFTLVLFRIYWRLRSTIPQPLENNRFLVALAKLVHVVIYLLIAFVPLIALTAGSISRGFDFFIWHWDPIFPVQKVLAHNLMDWHGLLAYSLAGFIGFHVLAALWHQFIKRDRILNRIWFR